MPGLNMYLDGDGIWPDLATKNTIQIPDDQPIGLALLHGGMASGKPSVTIRLDLPDGTPVVAQTSLKLLEAFVRVARAREAAGR